MIHHAIARCFLLFCVCLALSLVVVVAVANGRKSFESGCRDGTTEALQDGLHPKVAACRGSWSGHVRNSSVELCSRGWRVCSWHDHKILRAIRWSDVVRIRGCYAYNAAQDSSPCGPCLEDDVTQDNMAGLGIECLRVHRGQRSCTGAGKVEATCCRDAERGLACRHRKGLTSGVLCCKMSGTPPRIISQSSSLSHVTSGDTIVLSCLASGSPGPKITWFHNGLRINESLTRISALDLGYLIIANSREDDDGWYHCLAVNKVGSESSVPTKVVVRDHKSGCAKGGTAGLYDYEEIHACRGRWKGHVKRAKVVCAKGWQVCNPGHVGLLKMITWLDVTELLTGCYAYNAQVNPMGLCVSCSNGQLAGVGSGCERKVISGKSCLAEGQIAVTAANKSIERSRKGRRWKACHHEGLQGKVDGVLCCKRSARRENVARWRSPRCRPSCKNEGVCVADDRCRCPDGYHGKSCETPICPAGCIKNSECVAPRLCRCLRGFYGPDCLDRQP